MDTAVVQFWLTAFWMELSDALGGGSWSPIAVQQRRTVLRRASAAAAAPATTMSARPERIRSAVLQADDQADVVGAGEVAGVDVEVGPGYACGHPRWCASCRSRRTLVGMTQRQMTALSGLAMSDWGKEVTAHLAKWTDAGWRLEHVTDTGEGRSYAYSFFWVKED